MTWIKIICSLHAGFYWAHFLFFWYSATITEPLLKSFPGTKTLTQTPLLSAAWWQLLPSVVLTRWGLSWPNVLAWPETYSLLLCLRWRTKADWTGCLKNIYILMSDWTLTAMWRHKKSHCVQTCLFYQLKFFQAPFFPLASFPPAFPSFWLMQAGSVVSFLKPPANNREHQQKRSLEITAIFENWRALPLCHVSQVNAALITVCQQSFYLMWLISNLWNLQFDNSGHHCVASVVPPFKYYCSFEIRLCDFFSFFPPNYLLFWID